MTYSSESSIPRCACAFALGDRRWGLAVWASWPGCLETKTARLSGLWLFVGENVSSCCWRCVLDIFVGEIFSDRPSG